MTTIKDIAKLSGYSIGTVSRVINHHPDVSKEAKAIIEKVILEQNYKPNSNAKQLKQQGYSPVMIMIKGYSNIFFANLLEQVEQVLREHNEEAAVFYLDEFGNEVKTAIQLSISKNPKGFIFLGGNLEYFKEDFDQIKVPSVMITNTAVDLPFDNLSSFSTDDVESAMSAMNYLIDKGHTKIGIIGGTSSKEGSQVGYRRMIGCKKAFESHGLTFDETKQYIPARFTLEGGYLAMNELLESKQDITAVFAISDAVALGAIRAIHDAGLKIPQDISIIGYDGIDMVNYITPRLATVKQDTKTLALLSVKDLLKRIRKQDGHVVHEVVDFEVVDGESVLEID